MGKDNEATPKTTPLEFGEDTPRGIQRRENPQPDAGNAAAKGNEGDDADSDDGSGDDGGGKGDKRYQHWQSKYNKLEQEMQQMRQAMMSNNGGGQARNEPDPNDPAVKVKEVRKNISELKPPKAPSKPSDYDPAEAYSNPDSASYKYREKMESYQQDRDEYMSQKDQLRDELMRLELENMKKPLQQMFQQTQQQTQQQKTVANLISNYQFTPEQAQDFVQKMSDPNSLSLDNLVHFYRVQSGLKSHQQGAQPPSGGRNPNQGFAAPTFPNSSGYGTPETDTDEEREIEAGFAQGLLKFSNPNQ